MPLPNTGLSSKMMSAPKVVLPPEMLALDKVADPLEEELDRLRQTIPGGGPSMPAGPTSAGYERVRELRRQLASIGIRQRDLFFQANPDWVAHWGLRKD